MTPYQLLIDNRNLAVVDQFTRDDYTELIGVEVKTITKKAVLIVKESGLEEWYPISQMATDPDGNIYVNNWLT